MSKVYFSCPKFTVLLVTNGPVIVKAAPIVKRFEGQTLAALAAWVKSKSWGPIIVETLAERPTVVSRVLHDDLGRKSKCWN
jgi:hypothetical protein